MLPPQIEHGIPIPPANYGGRNRRRRVYASYPLSALNVGDSFFVCPHPDENLTQAHMRVSSAVANHCCRNPGKFLTRQQEGGIRVWRKK